MFIKSYIEKINAQSLGGHSNWRLPTQEEAWSLFDLNQSSKDKYGEDIYLDPVFKPGSAGTTWTADTKDSAALVIQYEDGGQVWPSQYSHLNICFRRAGHGADQR